MRPRKLQIGDLVSRKIENCVVYKTHKHPMDVVKYLEDINNPRLIFSDDENIPVDPESCQQNYLVSDVRDLFNRFGYRTRCVKIVGLVDATEGWIPMESLDLIAQGSET